MINLIHTLMHQQHRLIIRSQQTRRKRSFPKRYRASLYSQAHIDPSVNLLFGDGRALGEEVRGNGTRGG